MEVLDSAGLRHLGTKLRSLYLTYLEDICTVLPRQSKCVRTSLLYLVKAHCNIHAVVRSNISDGVSRYFELGF